MNWYDGVPTGPQSDPKRLKKEYDEWMETNHPDKIDALSDDDMKQLLEEELAFSSAMSVEEYTLWHKWLEIHRKYPTKEVSTLFGTENVMVNPKDKHIIDKAKSMLWVPETTEDYLKLEPEMVLTDTNWLREHYHTVRLFGSTMRHNLNPGRNMYYLVIDKVTGKYLGVICITGDFLDLTPRDDYIGWTREQRSRVDGPLLNSCIGSSIVPTQPLGHDYVGGKLLALLCLSDTVQEDWKRRYGQTLAGVTTTSLYGSYSQYNGLKYWHKRGKSKGSIVFEPTRENLYKVRDWTNKRDPVRYFELYVGKRDNGQMLKRDFKFRMLNWVYSQLKIKDTKTDHQRGIYYSHLYENTAEFLREEIPAEKLKKRFDTSTEHLVKLWKDKYATKRINSLRDSDRVKNETLFYDELIYLSWDETKAKYLQDVGR